jgi:hypothetical protein
LAGITALAAFNGWKRIPTADKRKIRWNPRYNVLSRRQPGFFPRGIYTNTIKGLTLLFLKLSSSRHVTETGFLSEVSKIAVIVNKIRASKQTEVFLNDTIHDRQRRNE